MMPVLAPLIFVGSTKEDLDEYRAAIRETLPQLDALYRGMELFGARPARPLDVMLDEVSACDLFVCILAHLYGSTDPATGLSYTELEYRTATSHKIPILIFVIDPSHPVIPERVERDPGKRQKLEAFKSAACREHAVVEFTTPDNLAQQVAQAIRNWLQTNQPILKDPPLSAQDWYYIRQIYLDSEVEIIQAVRKLRFRNCRAALEHFYGLLCRAELPSDIRDGVFDAITMSDHHERVAEILTDLLDKTDPYLRGDAVRAVGDRAQIGTAPVAQSHVGRVFRLADDMTSESVRFEVAHALWKIAFRRPDLGRECVALLERLTQDDSARVRGRAERSLEFWRAGGGA
jgi:hypothetical protein